MYRRHYIDVQRREEGFDSSSPTNLMGNFSSTKGTAVSTVPPPPSSNLSIPLLSQGTFHYNSLQDRHLKHYYQQPLVRRQLVEAGVIHPGMLRDVVGGVYTVTVSCYIEMWWVGCTLLLCRVIL